MSVETIAVWTCECGDLRTSGLPAARCPICKSEFMTLPNGNLVVTSGSWSVTNAYRHVSAFVQSGQSIDYRIVAGLVDESET